MIVPDNTSRDIYADKGYVSSGREARPQDQGCRIHIQRKVTKDKALSQAQERRNRRIASLRARVKQVFTGLAQLGAKMLRSIGMARATLHLNLKAATNNLHRFVYLKEKRPGSWRSGTRGPSELPKMADSGWKTNIK